MFVMILLVPFNQNMRTTVYQTLKNGCKLSYKGIAKIK
jgi:hypothetical protein